MPDPFKSSGMGDGGGERGIPERWLRFEVPCCYCCCCYAMSPQRRREDGKCMDATSARAQHVSWVCWMRMWLAPCTFATCTSHLVA